MPPTKNERRHIQIKTDTCRDSFIFLRCFAMHCWRNMHMHATKGIFLYWQSDAGASHSLLIILEIQETPTENDKMFRIYFFHPFLSLRLPYKNYMSVIFYSRLFFMICLLQFCAPGRNRTICQKRII